MRHPSYGADAAHPHICFAVSLNSTANKYRYALRFNITNVDETTEGPSPNFPATFFFKFYPWTLVSPLSSGMLEVHNLVLNYILQ